MSAMVTGGEGGTEEREGGKSGRGEKKSAAQERPLFLGYLWACGCVHGRMLVLSQRGARPYIISPPNARDGGAIDHHTWELDRLRPQSDANSPADCLLVMRKPPGGPLLKRAASQCLSCPPLPHDVSRHITKTLSTCVPACMQLGLLYFTVEITHPKPRNFLLPLNAVSRGHIAVIIQPIAPA